MDTEPMAESVFGIQSLEMSASLGMPFFNAVNSPSEGDPDFVREVRKVLEIPGMSIIGYQLSEGEGEKEVIEKLGVQMALVSPTLSSLRNRLAGREHDMALVVLGVGNIPEGEKRRKFFKDMKKLKLKNSFLIEENFR